MRRKTRKQLRRWISGGAVLIVVGGAWWLWPDSPETVAQQGSGPLAAAGAPIEQRAPAERVPVIVLAEPPAAEPPVDKASANKPPVEDEPLTPAVGSGRLVSDQVLATAPDAPDAADALDVPDAPDAPDADDASSATMTGPPLAASAAPEAADPDPAPDGRDALEPAAPANPLDEKLSADARIDAALKRYMAGDRIAARTELNRMLQVTTDPALSAELRRHLAKIADETVFGREIAPGDPLLEHHRLEDGQYLSHLEKIYHVPYEMIMRINGIADARRVQAGQRLRAPRGPFHAVIHKSQFRLDLYLQDLYLRSFAVGLGADSSTPTGDWVVKECLPNPTYYPPASATDRRIIGPDDPRNPLGEYWIGLEGVSGDAVGQVGFGIHGTIEPDSVGRNASMGCVRMLEDDIAFVYSALLERKSKVKIVP